MGKKELGILCLIIAVILGLTLDVAGQGSEGEMCVPMGTITIEAPDGVEATKASVNFPHSVHFETDCKTCHHKWTGKENIQGCMSTGCHDSIQAPETSARYLSYSDVSIKYFKYAFHQACIGCPGAKHGSGKIISGRGRQTAAGGTFRMH